jgi:hypothetical protein
MLVSLIIVFWSTLLQGEKIFWMHMCLSELSACSRYSTVYGLTPYFIIWYLFPELFGTLPLFQMLTKTNPVVCMTLQLTLHNPAVISIYSYQLYAYDIWKFTSLIHLTGLSSIWIYVFVSVVCLQNSLDYY